MVQPFLYGLAAAIAVTAAVFWVTAFRRQQRSRRLTELDSQRRSFRLARERLEFEFVGRARRHEPRGLTLVECAFDDAVTFVRDRRSGNLLALVATMIRFEPVPGGDLEDNPNAIAVRVATAVFCYQGGTWQTDGRALFNLDPRKAVRHLHREVEQID